MVLKTPMDKLIIFLCMIIWCFRHKCTSPTFHNGPIPFGPFSFNVYTSNTPSATLSRILDNGIGMMDSNFAFLTYPPFPTHFHLIYRSQNGRYRRLETYIYILTIVHSSPDSWGWWGHWQIPSCICAYPLFPLCSTDTVSFEIPSNDVYILYDLPLGGFAKGREHNPPG